MYEKYHLLRSNPLATMSDHDNKVSLLRMTDEQLQEGYERSLEHVEFTANNYYAEIQRRSQDRHSRAIRWLTVAIASLTFITTVATVFAAVVVLLSKC